MRDESKKPERGDLKPKIIAAVFTVGILVVMVTVNLLMRHGTKNTNARKMPRRLPASAQSAAPAHTCAITSKPSGAQVQALRDGELEDLGVTPTTIPQGDYRIRLRLEGRQEVELYVGLHLTGICAHHRDLALARVGDAGGPPAPSGSGAK